MSDKGRIILSASILCARCGNWNDLPEASRKREAAALARQIGYRFTRAEGWVCPSCIHDAECPECSKPPRHCQRGYDLHRTFRGGF